MNTYLVRVCDTCPEGAVTGITYWATESEVELAAWLKLGNDYRTITCIGVITCPTFEEKMRTQEMMRVLQAEQRDE